MPSVKAELILEMKQAVTAQANQAAAAILGVGKATNTANAQSKTLGKTLGSLSQSVLGINLATIGWAGGIALVGTGLKKAVDATVAYAASVRDLSRDMGVSAEEASTLIQIGDDLKVSYDTLKMAAREMNKDGIQPNLVNIKLLAAEYQALKTPVEQAQFATDHFGRSAAEMRKILEATPAALDAMAKSARDAGLVMSKEGVQAARDYEIALDDVQDSLQGLSITAGQKVIPPLTRLLKNFNEGDDVTRQFGITADFLNDKLGAQADELARINQLMQETTTVSRTGQHAMRDQAAVMDRVAAATAEAALQTGALAAGLSGTLQQAQDDYNAALALSDANLEALSVTLRRTTNEFLFQQLAVDGDWKANLELARVLGVLDEASYNAALVAGTLKQSYEEGKFSAEQFGVKAGELADAIGRLQDKHITITETHIYEELHTNQWSSDENRGQYGGGFASGADFVVPPGYPNDSYPMRVQSGEHVQVTPAGQAPGNSPTIGTVNVYGTTDPAETARLVGREIAGQLRRAMSGGVGAIGR